MEGILGHVTPNLEIHIKSLIQEYELGCEQGPCIILWYDKFTAMLVFDCNKLFNLWTVFTVTWFLGEVTEKGFSKKMTLLLSPHLPKRKL